MSLQVLLHLDQLKEDPDWNLQVSNLPGLLTLGFLPIPKALVSPEIVQLRSLQRDFRSQIGRW